MISTRSTWLMSLLGLSLTACTTNTGDTAGQYQQAEYAWPGQADGLSPWDFTGRIDAELCGDGVDNNGNGTIDEGCTTTCQYFTTRSPSWWNTDSCVMDGSATGFTAFPIKVGTAETYNSAAEVQTVLAVSPGGDAKLQLRRQLLVMKLNAEFYGLWDEPVVDWNGDGTVNDVQWLVDKADAYYDTGPSWFLSTLTTQFREMNAIGTGIPLWFDETCTVAAEYCDGIDNDGDGTIDEDCGCIETCGDSYDNDFDGLVDEGCTACSTLQSRNEAWWEAADCVVGGSIGVDLLPLTLGTAETYSTSTAVNTMLTTTTTGSSLDRLRHKLMTAKLNRAVFNYGTFPGADWNGDGTVETVDELITQADVLFDSGSVWQQVQMTVALKTANALGTAQPIWFRDDCATSAEFCDGIDNDGDGLIDEDCGCVETCDGYDNNFDGVIDELWPSGCPADEICDGIDNDGDGLIDEPDAIDAVDWFRDADNDTYGNPGLSIHQCYISAGYVADNTDCNDASGAVYPLATDICDGLDNDCDGDVDDQGPSMYADADADTYGDATVTTTNCSPPASYVTDNTDCNDGDPAIHPLAVDICADGIDQDCNGSDLGCYSTSSGTDAIFIGEAASDDAGVAAARVGDVDGDLIDDVIIGARNNDLGGTDAGAAYLFYGPVTYTGEVSLANADLKVYGVVAGDKTGRTTIGGSDLNGDGTADVTIGAPNEDSAGTSSGAAYVFFGSTLSAYTVPTAAATDADLIFNGRDAYDYLGARTSYSELTGDATVDLLLSNTGDSVGGASAGGIYVYAGPLTASATAINISSGTWAARIAGETANDQMGLYVGTGGDANGDGSGDLVIGVPRQDGAGTDAGATYLVAGPLSGTTSLTAADAKISGAAAGDKLGSAVSFAGDQNADGYGDFFTTAPFDDTTASNAGMVYLVYGTATLSSLDATSISTVAASTIAGKEASGQLGSSVAADGDHNGDGVNDLVTGANNDGPAAEGATYLYYGPVSGAMDWTAADWSSAGSTAYDHSGSFVSYGGDLRSIGSDTIIIGAREADVGATVDSGKVTLVFAAGF